MASPNERAAQLIADIERKYAQLDAKERSLLALVAIGEPVGVTAWKEMAQYAGIRESAARALSTTTIREASANALGLGLIAQHDGLYRCARGTRSVVLRLAVKLPNIDALIGAGVYRGFWDRSSDARLSVHRQLPDAEAALKALVTTSLSAATMLALELLHPLDETWLSAQPAAVRSMLLELAMLGLERAPSAADEPYQWLAPRLAEARDVSARAAHACAGIAALRGDLDVLRAVAASPVAARLGTLAAVAVGVIEGRYDEAARIAESCDDLERSDHCGTLALLMWFALRVASPGGARGRKLAALGARSGAPLQQTFRVAQAMDAALASGTYVRTKIPREGEPDALTALWMMLHGEDPSDAFASFAMASLLGDAERLAQKYGTAGYHWLSEQIALAAWSLESGLPPSIRSSMSERVKEPKGCRWPALGGARSSRPEWETRLERLAELAGAAPGAQADQPASTEQILWRVTEHGLVEPYLQKLTGAKWTAGRKLAIKHLLRGSDQLVRLPPEDQRVAEHAREDRRINYGYPVVEHSMSAPAWLALVGHPRVYLDASESPVRVVMGTMKLRVRSEGGDTVVTLDPADVSEGISVRKIGGELVVFHVPPRTKPLLSTVGRAGLRVPAEGKERLLGLLERLAPVVAIESTEATNAKRVPADATPRMRLVPGPSGLEVTLLVRPFGASGPLLAPGSGAPALLHHVAGETVQVERDLAQETRNAAGVLAACPGLVDCDTGPNSWLLGEPTQWLELVSALGTLGDAVNVEWPHGKPLRVRGRVTRRSLQGSLREGEPSFFELKAAARVDSELSLEVSELLELLAKHPGRFVQLASGEYVELEQELRDLLDGIAAARRGKRSKSVEVPVAALSVLEQLTEEGGALALDEGARGWRERFAKVWQKAARLPKSFAGELREYQLEGFRWLARLADLQLGACLADDMGLGKTIQLIALLLHRASGGPALVVAPTSVCENWRREITRFAPSLSIRAFWGGDRKGELDGLGARSVVVTSYALLQQDAEALQAIEWNTAILDEAQLIKNAETLRAKAAFGLRVRARIAATGTPVENHAGDIYSLFHFLSPGLLGPWQRFAAAMAERGAGEGRGYRRLLQPFVLRRTKAQVLEDLPPMTEIERTVLFSPAEAKLYESVRKTALEKLAKADKSPQGRVQVLAELTRLRRLCCHPELVSPGAGIGSSKLESLIELLEELVAGRHRVLVFSQFTDVLALVRPLLDEKKITHQYLDGATPMKRRAAAVDAFQAGDGDVFLISLKAGGFGLNLTAADYVVHVDPWWNPAVEQQASDRAHRIGQTRPVTVYRLVTAGTIEAGIVELHRKKRELADALLEGTDQAATLTAAEIRQLLAV